MARAARVAMVVLALTAAAGASGCGAAAAPGRAAAQSALAAPRLFFGPLSPAVIVHLRALRQRAIALRERADVFAKVGDSNTANAGFLRPLGCPGGARAVGRRLAAAVRWYAARRLPSGYQPLVFAPPLRCPSNSFTRIGFAAHTGWGVDELLAPFPIYRLRYRNRHLYPLSAHVPGSRVVELEHPPHGSCPHLDAPALVCELRAIHPSLAFVMIGTNNLGHLSARRFAGRLQQVLAILERAGTLPVLSTIPPDRPAGRAAVAAFNAAIGALARRDRLPLWDLWRALTASGHPLSPDGIHLAVAPAGGGDLRPAALAYGFNLRNHQSLEILQLVHAAVGR